jgi:hypothetical protein
MLEDRTNGKLEEIKAFAAETGREEQLQKELDYLGNYSAQETKCVFFPDFAPYSLSFNMERKEDGEWVHWFNGGLIFHGSHDGLGSGAAPTHSVCLTPTDGWGVHT